eukprot:6100916-Prymnesium_polylepis.1
MTALAGAVIRTGGSRQERVLRRGAEGSAGQRARRAAVRRGGLVEAGAGGRGAVSYTHLRAHETLMNL